MVRVVFVKWVLIFYLVKISTQAKERRYLEPMPFKVSLSALERWLFEAFVFSLQLRDTLAQGVKLWQ